MAVLHILVLPSLRLVAASRTRTSPFDEVGGESLESLSAGAADARPARMVTTAVEVKNLILNDE